MHVEVSVALNFVISYLYNKLPRRRVDMFAEELERLVKERFQGHWYPERPAKGSAFRCVRVSGQDADPIMDKSARLSGMDIEEIRDYLPKDLSIWIDPCEVSYRIGEKGPVKILYSNKDNANALEGLDKEIQAASKGFNPDAQCFKPIDSLSSSMNNLNLSPSSPVSPHGGGSSTTPPLASFLNRTNQTPMFTTAMFAQTKFGSTKLKSQAKRPSRLSPTEGNCFYKTPGNQRSPTGNMLSPTGTQLFPGQVVEQPSFPLQQHQQPQPGFGGHAQRPRTLFPTSGRGYVDRQQRVLLLAQQQQSQTMLSPVSPVGTKPSPQLGGSLNDLYGTYHMRMSEYQDGAHEKQLSSPMSLPSPEEIATAAYNDSLLLPNTLQHMLLAN